MNEPVATIIYNYYCLNSECENNKMQCVNKSESEKDTEEPCIDCGQPMKLVGERAHGGYAKVGSMTPEQRRKVLLERSHQHFKKEIEPRKHEMNKQFDQQAREKFTGKKQP